MTQTDIPEGEAPPGKSSEPEGTENPPTNPGTTSPSPAPCQDDDDDENPFRENGGYVPLSFWDSEQPWLQPLLKFCCYFKWTISQIPVLLQW